MSNKHPGNHQQDGHRSGMRKIRRIFGRTSHTSSKNSGDETGTDEAFDEQQPNPVVGGGNLTMAQPGSSSSHPNPSASIGNSSTSSGRHHHHHSNVNNSQGMAGGAVPGTNATTSPTPTGGDHHHHQSPSYSAGPTPPAFLTQSDLEPLLAELGSKRTEIQRLQEEFDAAKTQMQSETSLLHQTLQEERYRFERIEEQMNDLIELHQNEIENLKQGIADMEEKIQYQSEERLRDVYEMLDSCQTRISRMEHQQHQHLQQLVNLDSLENTNARALVLKLINVLLTILQVILLLVATFASILTPFLQTRVRILTTLLFLLLFMVLFRQRKEVFEWIKFNFSDQFPILEVLLANTQDNT